RVLFVVTPQPVQRGPLDGSNPALSVAVHIAPGGGARLGALANVLAVRDSGIARRSASVRPVAIEIMGPDSRARRTRSGFIARSASRFGARSAPPSWHDAQLVW